MSRTFEEMASEELDVLYSGCLFLSAGNAGDAEQLLLSSVSRAFHQYAAFSSGADFGRWLEAHMVRDFLRGASAEQADRRGPRPEMDREGRASAPAQSAVHAFRAATKTVPAPARAALWLVLVQRRRYGDVAELMGVDRAQVREWLKMGASLMAEVDPPSDSGSAAAEGG